MKREKKECANVTQNNESNDYTIRSDQRLFHTLLFHSFSNIYTSVSCICDTRYLSYTCNNNRSLSLSPYIYRLRAYRNISHKSFRYNMALRNISNQYSELHQYHQYVVPAPNYQAHYPTETTTTTSTTSSSAASQIRTSSPISSPSSDDRPVCLLYLFL